MTGLSALWLPILLSAVGVFVVRCVVAMSTAWQKSDYRKMPNEDRVRDALRPLAIPPGDYVIPRPANREEMRSPAFADKMKQGPVAMFTVMPNGPAPMSRSLLLWFLYAVVVGVFAAYVTGRALPHAADYLRVFQFAGVTPFFAYSPGLCQISIWFAP